MSTTIIIIIIIIILIIILIYIYNKSNENFTQNDNTQEPLENTCACIFDIDGTISCSFDNVKKAVNTCKREGCILGINTARKTDVGIEDILNKADISKNDFSYIHTGKWSIFNGENIPDQIAYDKSQYLEDVYNDNNKKIEKKHIILFDDNINNINFAKLLGYNTIYANNPKCGLNNDVDNQILNILRS